MSQSKSHRSQAPEAPLAPQFPRSRSLAQLLEFPRDGAGAELVSLAEDVLAGRLPGHAAEDHAVEQGVATEPVVAVDATRDLTSGVEARDLAPGAHNLRILSDLETAHAVVDHWGDDRHVEGLRGHCGTRDDVVVELLPAARLASGLVPGLPRGIRGPRAAIGVLLRLPRSLVVATEPFYVAIITP